MTLSSPNPESDQFLWPKGKYLRSHKEGEAKLAKLAWLSKMADEQAKNIQDHVVLKSVTAVELSLTGHRLQLKSRS